VAMASYNPRWVNNVTLVPPKILATTAAALKFADWGPIAVTASCKLPTKNATMVLGPVATDPRRVVVRQAVGRFSLAQSDRHGTVRPLRGCCRSSIDG
jgi:hypothetical protein